MTKILLICKSIAPVQFISAVRWTKIAKYLKLNHDVHITVLTNHKDFSGYPGAFDPEDRDELLAKDLVYFDEYWEVPDDPLLARLHRQRYERKQRRAAGQQKNSASQAAPAAPAVNLHPSRLQKLKADIRMELFKVREYWEECRQARNMMRFVQDKELDFDVMVSSFSPAWTFMTAEKIKKKNPGIFWATDFRDPYPNKITDPPFSFALHRYAVWRHCRKADLATRVGTGTLTYTAAKIPVEVLTNGYDPAEAQPPQPPQQFSLVFTGTLYGKWTDLRPVFRAINDLCAAGEMRREDVIVHYAGVSSAEAEAMAVESRAQDLLECHGIVAREEALRLQQTAAVLIQCGEDTESEKALWTGKSYEYMMARKPSVYVVSGDVPYSLPAREISHLGGCCYEICRDEEMYPQFRQYILDKYREWKTTGNVTIQRDEDYVKQFAYPEIAERFWNLIQQKGKQA